jgi:ribonucleoside-triphosphate reductase (formate)
MEENKCNKETEVFSRVVGYFRPVNNWNEGKKEEFEDRQAYSEHKSIENKLCVEETKIIQKTKTSDAELKAKIRAGFA